MKVQAILEVVPLHAGYTGVHLAIKHCDCVCTRSFQKGKCSYLVMYSSFCFVILHKVSLVSRSPAQVGPRSTDELFGSASCSDSESLPSRPKLSVFMGSMEFNLIFKCKFLEV